MNRGVSKRPLFEDRQDARFFLSRMAQQVRKGRIEVHAFCLMTTHFHLLLRSPVGELSEAMRRIQNAHSRQFNRKRRRDGALVRGRYHSKPVHSLRYRRTLVRYIDANPVKAGIVKRSSDYHLGSAREYLHSSSPKWLNRDWIEHEACALSGASTYSAQAYRRVFGGGFSADAEEFVDARMLSSEVQDPLDDLIGAAPRQVRDWLQRKARLADGRRVGLPVCGRLALAASIHEDSNKLGPWTVADGKINRDGAELCSLGFQRDLGGLRWEAIALPLGISVGSVRRHVDQHRRLVVANSEYADRSAGIAKMAMERCS